ncbi:MAG: amino acid permease [Bacilli bacterium]|nr:amino acid permease [Bacilli bacterium]MBN2877147.1 amino acid permease [Bacilli bacterium]
MKKVSLMNAISVGIGGMVGGGIFAVLGLAVTQASGATPLAFLIAGLIAIVTAYSYALLAKTIQNKGGTSSYINESFGKNVLSGGINNFLWISYIVMLALYASAFGSYAPNLIPIFTNPTINYHFFLSLVIVIATVVNYLSVSVVTNIEKWAVVFKMVILLFFIVIGIYGLFGSTYLSQLGTSSWPNTISIVAGGMLIFVAYEGFELIANVTPDMEKQSDIKKSFLYSTGFVIVLYILIAIITVGSLSFGTVATAQDYVLAEAAKPVLGQFGFILIVVAALISTFSAINATLYGSSRINYELAVDDELPHEFTVIIKNEPIGVIITAVLALLIANLIPLASISGIGSIGFLSIFLMVNISAYRLRKRIGGKPWIYIGGILLTLIALGTLIYEQIQSDIMTIIYTAGLMAICFLLEFFYKKSEYELKEKAIKRKQVN